MTCLFKLLCVILSICPLFGHSENLQNHGVDEIFARHNLGNSEWVVTNKNGSK